MALIPREVGVVEIGVAVAAKLVNSGISRAQGAVDVGIPVAAKLVDADVLHAGGIGQILYRDINFFQYGRVGMIIAATFVIVFIIDSFSDYIREKLK